MKPRVLIATEAATRLAMKAWGPGAHVFVGHGLNGHPSTCCAFANAHDEEPVIQLFHWDGAEDAAAAMVQILANAGRA